MTRRSRKTDVRADYFFLKIYHGQQIQQLYGVSNLGYPLEQFQES